MNLLMMLRVAEAWTSLNIRFPIGSGQRLRGLNMKAVYFDYSYVELDQVKAARESVGQAAGTV